MKLSLKAKTLGVFGIVLILSLIIGIVGYYTYISTRDYSEYKSAFQELKANLKESKRLQLDFERFDSKNTEALLNREDPPYYTAIHQELNVMDSIIGALLENDILEELNHQEQVEKVRVDLLAYREQIDSLWSAFKLKGFKDTGLEGKLRDAIHEVEHTEKDLAALIPGYDRGYSLMLRRREKDFFIRKDLKYLEKFKKDIEKYQKYLGTHVVLDTKDTNQQKINDFVAKIVPLVQEYDIAFTENVQVNQLIGLTNDDGIRGNAAEITSDIDQQFSALMENVNNSTSDSLSRLTGTFWILIVLLCIGIIIVSITFSNILVSGVMHIKKAMDALSSGEFPEDITIKTGDEFEELGHDVNDLKNRIRVAADFSREIGGGNLEISYEERYANDVLAQAIMEMQDKLKITAVEERTRSWHTAGIAKFGSILQEEKDNLKQLCRVLVSNLVKYVGANQAGIYVVNKENPKDQYLELVGSYAYDREKFIDQKFKKGEGLIGQCWHERKRIFMIDIPENYVTITSGLGASNPNCIVIIPLIYNEEVLGVIEMASFERFDDHELDFLEELGGNIAATLSSVRVAERTKLLLEESKMMQESLQAQEEEMRQNMEEMQATQDMMTEKENDYMSKIKVLEKQIKLLEQNTGSA